MRELILDLNTRISKFEGYLSSHSQRAVTTLDCTDFHLVFRTKEKKWFLGFCKNSLMPEPLLSASLDVKLSAVPFFPLFLKKMLENDNTLKLKVKEVCEQFDTFFEGLK